MRKTFSLSTLAVLAGFCAVLVVGCKKEDITVPNQEVVSFSQKSGSYFIQNDPNSVFKIPVGLTASPNASRTFTYTVTSPSGAQAGQQYTLASQTVTIPAGQTVDSITVKGLFSGYATGRKDTLIFTINGTNDVKTMYEGNKYTLYMQKYCPVVLSQFTGTYTAQDYYNGAPDGGPYPVTLTPGTATGTTGYVLMAGLWGFDTPPVRINLDWTNPAAFKTDIPTAAWFVHPTYGQATIRPNGSGTFSSCENKLTIGFEATVNAGSFGKYVTTLTK